jgi:hypothetical protein
MTAKKKGDDVSLSAGIGMTITAERMDRLIAEAQYKPHPYGLVWQPFDLDLFQELVGNVERRGLDQEIVLYQGKILEGLHRYLACLVTNTQPKFSEFQGTDLEAAERVHASGIRRQSSPEQRYASFILLCEACPAFKEKYEALKQKGAQQQAAGTPLSTDGQRVDVLGAKAADVVVGRSTAAKVETVKKAKPEAVAAIAAGKTSANKVLQTIKDAKGRDGPKAENLKRPDFKVGDVVCAVTDGPPLDSFIKEWRVKVVRKDGYLCTDGVKGKLIGRDEAETRERAKRKWTNNLKEWIKAQVAEIEYQKEILQRGPSIESVKKDGGQKRPSP